MKKIITCIALVLSSVQISLAEETKPSVELVEMLDFKNNFITSALAGFEPFLAQLEQQGMPQASIDKVKQAADSYFETIASDPGLVTDMATVYEANFTNDEIVELIAFYKTPLGKKTVTTMPKVMAQGAQVSEKYAAKHSQPFQATMQQIMTEAMEQQQQGPMLPQQGSPQGM